MTLKTSYDLCEEKENCHLITAIYGRRSYESVSLQTFLPANDSLSERCEYSITKFFVEFLC